MTMEPNLWDEVDGPGSISYYEDSDERCKIVVRQNAYVHEEINKLFDSLRSAKVKKPQKIARSPSTGGSVEQL